ncbi:MAG: AAA family ATPase [Lachnospiraceae bacterium]|jgi:putative ATP-dependent endonuclease of OLD family|nr:AAA family ATPase [Lachnospiraceae bacterium]
MQITHLAIRNFKSIRSLEIHNIEGTLILVGKNNTGKTGILKAIRAAFGNYSVSENDFNEKNQNIEISITLHITSEDLLLFHTHGIVSQYKRPEAWKKDFFAKLPSFDGETLFFTCIINRHQDIRYNDGFHKHNRFIPELLPRLYFIGTDRQLTAFQEDLLMFQEDEQLIRLRSNTCLFRSAKICNQCFSCIGLINQKKPEELQLYETARLLEYKMYRLNLNDFSRKVNENYQKNGGIEEILFTLTCNPDALFTVTAEARREDQQIPGPVEELSNGMKSIYMLSLLETYIESEKRIPSIIMVAYPELFLHPSLQKSAGAILYRLSRKNQVIFSTHSPNLIANFTSRQLCQVVTDEEHFTVAREHTDVDQVLEDLGYGANDLLNVSFVFIVEGKQDKNRLPLLLKKYYPELHDANGRLSRISILTTNSCTNIKTYANLKYMNQVYLQDQFLMIRDGDGKDREHLASQLCRYYDERNLVDIDKLPKVRRRNVLILKYYSFENYFLNPGIMAQLGIVKNEEEFWQILFSKWKEYLHRLSSGRHLTEVLGKELETIEELKENFENFKIFIRGHNLYDIFYGPFKQEEAVLLQRYIDLAPREDFQDILDAIEAFPFFESRKNP